MEATYITQGERNRVVAEHQLNRESSRSHTIFSIMLERSTGAEGDELIVSKLNLVDLAGSERISKTKSEGTVLKEAQQINKSLSFLEQACSLRLFAFCYCCVYCNQCVVLQMYLNRE